MPLTNIYQYVGEDTKQSEQIAWFINATGAIPNYCPLSDPQIAGQCLLPAHSATIHERWIVVIVEHDEA